MSATKLPEDILPEQGDGAESEGEGDVIMAGVSDDSSEEGEEDEEQVRQVQEGFIIDDDEELEEERRQRKRKKRRHHRHRQQEEEGLEDDDLDLLEENTGASFKKSRLSRLRRRSESPVASGSKRKEGYADSSDDDLTLPTAPDIQNIWDEPRQEEEDEDMDSFIESDEEGGAEVLDEKAREARRLERKRVEKERWKAQGGRSDLAGIDAGAWEEIHDIFGDGHEYDWALAGDDEEMEDEIPKSDMRYQDVFEPSVIKSRMLTEDDDLIRAQDIPERMQLAGSGLSNSSALSFHDPLTEDDVDGAALWITQRISSRKNREYFSPEGELAHLQDQLFMAVTAAVRYLFVHEFEVPYIWTHKRDYITSFDHPQSRIELINLTELWRIHTLGQKYRSLLKRKNTLESAYRRLGVSNEYYETQISPNIDSVEVVADATEWLSMMFKERKNDAFTLSFHDDEEQPEAAPKHKMPSRSSAYQVNKNSVVYKLAQGFGIQPQEVILNFLGSEGSNIHYVDDPELNPIAYAEQFADPDPEKAQSADELLARARMIIATELGKDPVLRQHARVLFKDEARISVEPTERGIAKIDEHHAYYNFKYLHMKSVKDMLESSQFLHILAAESELLVTVQVTLPAETHSDFEQRLVAAYESDGFSDTAKAWNEQRQSVIKEALEQHLLPAGAKWVREYIREEVEDALATQLNLRLRSRIDVAPYHTPHMKLGETPSILACSWGKGDLQKDAITIVFLDEAGRMREHTKIDNLTDSLHRDELMDILKRRKPDVIVVGGFTMATLKLTEHLKGIVGGGASGEMQAEQPLNSEATPIIYVFDDIARLYQHSKRAADEFGALSPIAKYCVGLARYAQSPLNEYAALGSDITSISFDEEDQHLISIDKQYFAFERALVDITNKVGVDINRAIGDEYYRHLLPFVCGLGPRKAQLLVQKIESIGGNLINRDQFIRSSLLTTRIFLNAAGFLRIAQDEDAKPRKGGHHDDDVQDPLDDTRVHPEDYELARKMATDALELDEEDVHDEHPSHVVSVIMHDEDNEKKLAELNLDEFAVSLLEANDDKKRHALDVIRLELLHPFSEYRSPFILPQAAEVLTMLSGETARTLRAGLIVSVQVTRIKPDTAFVRLDSGVEGVIKSSYAADIAPNDVGTVLKKHQTLPAQVMNIQMDLNLGQFVVELSSRQADVSGEGDSNYRRVRPDPNWNQSLANRHQDLQERKKRAEVNKARRVIKHPNFHNFNSSQAEAYLDKQPTGDVVIRPSSKGIDHLAVTWKVDEQLYQHIDVTEPNADPTGQTMGRELIVDANHRYADLDELIVTHVQVMARRVEDLKAHAKFISGTEEDLHLFLKNQLAANPGKSMYGFCLNRKKAGHFNLCFLANKASHVQTWPVRVAPEAYYLFEAPATGVPELCDAFKVRHLHESQNLGSGAGGKTPYGAGGRTPRAGGMSVRQVGRTPNPYGGGQTPAVNASTSASTGYRTPGPNSNYAGFQTPSHQPPAAIAGIHPSRAAMIQAPASGGSWPGGSTWGSSR